MPAPVRTFPRLSQQAERLITLGVHEIGGLSASELRAAVAEVKDADSLLVIHPDRAPASSLAALLEHGGKRGFIVSDMPDVDDFFPIEQVTLPSSPVYLVDGLDRGDHLANWSPDEALPAIAAAQRTPLTLSEGIHWLLHQPEALERGHCFMTIGSRRRKTNGTLAARTPAPPHPRNMDQQRHRPRRPSQPQRTKTRLVLGRQPAHWLGFASASRRVPGNELGTQHQ